MRRLAVSAVLVFGLWVPSASSAEQNDLDRQLRVLPERSVLGSLPSRTVIGGSLIRGGNWYVLSASEILALRKLLNREPFLPPKGVNFILLPPLMNRVVLWGIVDAKLELLDVLAVDDSVTILLPVEKGKPGWYPVVAGEEKECLQKLMKRIQEGKEQPVAKAQGDGILPKRAG